MTEHTTNDERRFWGNILRAVHTTPREIGSLVGASGLSHRVVAVGVDDTAKRIIVVSPEHDGRAAALVQTDIQAAMADYRVLTIRPAAVSLSKLAQAVQTVFGSPIVTSATFEAIQKDQNLLQSAMSDGIGSVMDLAKRLALPKLPQILELIQQLARLNFTPDALGRNGATGSFSIDLSNLLSYDPIAADRSVGVCGFPFYDFDEKAIDSIVTAISAEEVTQTLRQRDILQYFYPGADHLTLGLVERGITDRTHLSSVLDQAPRIGHPFGETEIVEAQASVLKTVDALQRKKFLVEGEFGFELTSDGTKARSLVKFKPKEGLISKLINQFSIKISLSDLFGKKPGQ